MTDALTTPDGPETELALEFGTAPVNGGSFTTAGTILCTDPCYCPGVHCTALVRVKPGKWNSAVERGESGTWGARTAALIVAHESLPVSAVRLSSAWRAYTTATIGVDAGCVGFYDAAAYAATYDASVRGLDGSQWPAEFDAIDMARGGFGVVSTSGYGDGSYVVYGVVHAGEVMALACVFCPADEDEDDDITEDSYSDADDDTDDDCINLDDLD